MRIPEFVITAVLLGQIAPATWAISPEQVQQAQAAGTKITVIDVRNNQLFQKSHVPGAINIPSTLIAAKTLPRLGRVVVYDDGLGRNAAEAAVTALNQKPGIQAEALDGGFAAWEAARAATTGSRQMERENIPMITYQQLKAARASDIVLVDLRKPAMNKPAKAGGPRTALTDLTAEFPGVRVVKSASDVPQTRQGNGPSAPPLLVLIDNGDGAAQETARALKTAGKSRFVVVAGGEEILARHGQAGLQRHGVSQNAPSTPQPNP